jgi:hypothetical protein
MRRIETCRRFRHSVTSWCGRRQWLLPNASINSPKNCLEMTNWSSVIRFASHVSRCRRTLRGIRPPLHPRVHSSPAVLEGIDQRGPDTGRTRSEIRARQGSRDSNHHHGCRGNRPNAKRTCTGAPPLIPVLSSSFAFSSLLPPFPYPFPLSPFPLPPSPFPLLP